MRSRASARVAFIGRNAEAGSALAAQLSEQVLHTPLFIQCDVTDISALQAAIAAAREAHGPVTALINNAANDARHTVEEVTVEFWDNAMNINLRHQFFLPRKPSRPICSKPVAVPSSIWAAPAG